MIGNFTIIKALSRGAFEEGLNKTWEFWARWIKMWRLYLQLTAYQISCSIEVLHNHHPLLLLLLLHPSQIIYIFFSFCKLNKFIHIPCPICITVSSPITGCVVVMAVPFVLTSVVPPVEDICLDSTDAWVNPSAEVIWSKDFNNCIKNDNPEWWLELLRTGSNFNINIKDFIYI